MPATARREAQLQALAAAAMDVARAATLPDVVARIRTHLLATTGSTVALVAVEGHVAGALPATLRGETERGLRETAEAAEGCVRVDARTLAGSDPARSADAFSLLAIAPRRGDGEAAGLVVIGREGAPYEPADEAALIQLASLATLTADGIASRAAERRMEEEVAISIRAANLGRWMIDLATGERRWDPRLRELLELEEHEQTREATMAVVHPDDRAVVAAAMEAATDPAGTGEIDVSYRVFGARTGTLRTIRAVGRASFVDGRCERLTGVVEDITKWVAAETERRYREQAFRLAVEAADLGMWDLEIATNRLHWSDRCRGVFGVGADEAITLDDFYAFLHPDDRASVRAAFTASTDPAVRSDYAAEFRIVKRTGEIRWIDASGRGLFTADGRCERAIGTVIDVTDRKQSEIRTQLVAQEMHHRVKNSIAMAQAVARQTFRNAADLAGAEETLLARFGALAAVQDVLVGREAPTGRLAEIVARGVVALAPPGRVRTGGPDIVLDRKRSIAVALAFHELVTNATKYGALSTGSGMVTLAWEVDDRLARLSWRETGGPKVVKPDRRGFGTRLIERMLADELDGGVSVDWNPDGLVVTLAIPCAA